MVSKSEITAGKSGKKILRRLGKRTPGKWLLCFDSRSHGFGACPAYHDGCHPGVITLDLRMQLSIQRSLLSGFWVSWVCLLDGALGSDGTMPSHAPRDRIRRAKRVRTHGGGAGADVTFSPRMAVRSLDEEP